MRLQIFKMYQVNRLNRNVLITPKEVLFHTESELDEKNLWSNIIVAEERFVKKMLCRDLYDDIRLLKNVIVTESNITELQVKVNAENTGPVITLAANRDRVNAIELVSGLWYQELWFEYLAKICAECVLYVSTPTRWLQSKAAGEMHNNPAGVGVEPQAAASADLRDVKWKMDKMLMDRIDPLIEGMRDYLCTNKANFLKFNCVQCPQDENSGVSWKRKTGWVHGIYDTPKKDCSINKFD